MKKSFLLISSFLYLTNLWATTPISPMHDYEISNISKAQGESIWNEMKEANSDSECFNRAMAWTYDMHKQHNINVGKIILHYSARYNELISSEWGFHIAPLLKVENVETVFDKGFTGWLDEVLTTDLWVDKFLENGRQKLIRKRKEYVADRLEAQRELEALRPSALLYERKRRARLADIAEANAKLREYLVTDDIVNKLSQDYIVKLEEQIARLEQSLASATASEQISINEKITEKTQELSQVRTDKDLGIHFQCKEITHIEEHYNHLNDEWCATQKISMYYWGPPQLRLLNYGMDDIPLPRDLNQAYINGQNFVRTSFDMEQVWIAREEAFDNYRSLWREEWREKEREEERARDERRRERRNRFGF